MIIEKNIVPKKEKIGRSIEEKYKPMFDLEPRNRETKQGDAAVLPYTDTNYKNIVKSLLPRWNKRFAPRHWVHSSDYRNGKRVIIVQRSA